MLHSFKEIAAGCILALSCAVAQSDATFSEAGYAADAYGASDHYPLPVAGHARTQKEFVGYYTHYADVRPVDPIARTGTPSSLESAEHELTLKYPYGDRIRSINDYLDRNPVTGLLIARGDTILYEHYRYARKDTDRFMSQSMAKTIVGMLIGIAVSEGSIHSIDDLADVYVPELADSAYGRTSIRDLLHMSSGVTFFEDDNAGDDRDKLGRDLFSPNGEGAIAAVIPKVSAASVVEKAYDGIADGSVEILADEATQGLKARLSAKGEELYPWMDEQLQGFVP